MDTFYSETVMDSKEDQYLYDTLEGKDRKSTLKMFVKAYTEFNNTKSKFVCNLIRLYFLNTIYDNDFDNELSYVSYRENVIVTMYRKRIKELNYEC